MEATPICQAWLRPDGGKGIRNKVLVLYTVECSKHVAESIAAHFQAQHRDVDVTGSLACLDNQAVVQRMLAYCVHPNVGAVLIVGHGCEYIEPDRIRDFARAHGRPAEAFYLQKVGGTEAGIALGCRLVGEMLEKIEAGPRAPMYAQELIIGAKCGGSDFTSGIAGNAVIGKFFENLTAAGGTAMMEEIAEAVGLRDHLVSRAVNVDVARDVALTYDKTMEFCRRLGRYSISPGNFVGGLTTIEEKSMGAVVKMGGCRIEGVLKIAQRPKHPGFWLLDVIPDDKPEPAFFFGGDATGLLDQIACGCHLVLFNTGRGHVGGTPVAPILNYAFYFSEIFRAGIEGVPKGQQEAAQVLGLTGPQTFFHITLLQMVKRIVPPLSNEVITLVKVHSPLLRQQTSANRIYGH